MGGYAWVTLATNDSYSLGALVLANSLRRVGTVHQLAVLITPGVTNSMREKLSSVFNVVKEVNILDSKDQNNLRLLQRPELGITFTKLNCWRLTQFDKCVFLDADTLVLQNSDELFDREEFSAAPDVGWPDCFNSGVYVYRPSEATYENLVKFALQTGSFDGADQGLLNLYFNEWAHKDISKHLPFIYNVCSTATYSYIPAFKQYSRNIKIIHFIGNSKPWLQHFDFETLQVQINPGLDHLHGITQQWWEIFCSSVHPVLSQQMAGLAGAFAQLTLGCARTAEQRILEDNLRRQNWESGNIDYMGRDAFDNIWSKICETLSTSETSVTQEKEQTPPTAAIPEKDVSSKLSIDILSPEPVLKEEKPKECTATPIIDTTTKSVAQEDSSRISETDVAPPSAPTQETVSVASSVPATIQSVVDASPVEPVPSIPETITDSSIVLPEGSKVAEEAKVCEVQPSQIKDKQTLVEESKVSSLATESSQKPLQTETIQSEGSSETSSAIKSSETTATVVSPVSDVPQSSEIQTPTTPIECVKTDEKSNDIVPKTPQSVPLSVPSPQTEKLETQSVLHSKCPLTDVSQDEAAKATTTLQQTKGPDTPKPKETPKSPSLGECSLKTSPEVESVKVLTKESGSSKPQETAKTLPPTETSLKSSPEVEPLQVVTKESGIPKPQEISKSSPTTECSLKKSPETKTEKSTIPQQIKGSAPTKPQEVQKLPQAEAEKVSKPLSTAPQQPKDTLGASIPDSQKLPPKVQSEKEPKASTKTQSSEAAAVSGSQQGPAPPPRKSGGTKKSSGKPKK